MSWKGFQKALQRLPHTILASKAEGIKDPEFDILESAFKRSTNSVQLLFENATHFRNSISALVNNQVHMAEHINNIYDNNLGVDVPEDAIRKRERQTSSTALDATRTAKEAMHACRNDVLGELDVLDDDVVRPLKELKTVIATIEKTCVKRSHKLIDLDRHTADLKKLVAKETRSLSEEKKMIESEAKRDIAQKNYTYLNEMLKDEIPKYLKLKARLITPIQNHFYSMQCRIYWAISQHCSGLLAKTNHFSTLQSGIKEGYDLRKIEHDYRAELDDLDLLKAGGRAWQVASGDTKNSKLSLQERRALREGEKTDDASYSVQEGTESATPYSQPPPPYVAQNGPSEQMGIPNHPPPPLNASKGGSYVIALYDYTAQVDGDLSFKEGDRIEVVERSDQENDWWTGRLNNVTGIFPGNYVRDI